MRNGLVEILVYAIIKDENLFYFIEENIEKIIALDSNVLEELIYWNCKIKSAVVQRDEVDVGERAILNFGHTYGHAIESYYDYRYRHDECVAVGIIGACYIAERKGLITKNVTNRILRILVHINVLHQMNDCNQQAVLEGQIYFILPLRIGKVERFQI
jgi:3-dehydroquinate synthase